MQTLSAVRAAPAGAPDKTRRDPAPSRVAYRMHRVWLTPLYRALLRVGLPVFVGLTALGWYVSDEANRIAITDKVAELRRTVEERPEFTVKLMAIEGASPVVDQAIRAILPIDFPLSSFDLDLEEIQSTVAALDVVEDASVRIRPGGVLEIALVERMPALVWRNGSRLELLDATGHRVATLTDRTARPDLSVIAGEGAEDAVPEALNLIAAAAPISDQLRGLVRVGERRWTLVLTDDRQIYLPETNPVRALEQVIALDEAQDLFARDIAVVDMRNPLRPTLRLTPPAVEELRQIRSLSTGVVSR